MTSLQPIKTLFAKKIDRPIEEVIKVDQPGEEIIRDEIREYVVTDAIRGHYTRILEAYLETPNKPHEGIAVWVSGFFGSGKSSFAKMLGLSVSNRTVAGQSSAELFAQQAGDNKVRVLLKAINEKIPTHAVIFDVSTDRGIRSGNQTLTEIMYGVFLQSLGYARDLDLSELEIELESRGQLEAFQKVYAERHKGRLWDEDKGRLAFAFNDASVALHAMDKDRFPAPDSWWKAAKGKNDITPGKLAERIGELMKRRRPGQSLMFVIDEVGQFVARDVQKMLDLQAIVQNLGVRGRGKHWVVVTSQEQLGDIVTALRDSRPELARLMDRFPLQVHLEASDISEVTSKRVLAKNAAAQATLGKLFDDHRGRLTDTTHLTADVKLPELSRDRFVDLYPLLPYQIDLVIDIVSGLRTQGGASKHVGGANRTIIKLAQQLLINPAVNLADASVGDLVRLDQVYDLVEGNIGSDVRAKISGIQKELGHPLAQRVAKVICLLQYVKTVHRSAENIAAALQPSVGGDSQVASVKEALRALEAAHKVRLGEGGYRIPTPAEDDWERLRNGIGPKPGDSHRIYSEVLAGFWQPQPSHTLCESKVFKAGLAIHGRQIESGDLMFQIYLAEAGKEFEQKDAEIRTRSRAERKDVFWAIAIDDAIEREVRELFRSKEMLARKERETKGEDAPALIAEERQRLRRHNEEIRRLLRLAALSGAIYFQGNSRRPTGSPNDVGKAASEVLGQVLPQVFERFQEAAAKVTDVKKGIEALFTAENLQGLPPVFANLALLRDELNRPVFRTEGGPLKEIQNRIEERANYGDTASGRYLADEFAKEPFGWDFDVVRLLVLALLRAGKIEVTSSGLTIDTAMGADARKAFENNPFKQASFRPKKGVEFEQLVRASAAFQETFGRELPDITSARPIVAELHKEIARHEEAVAGALSTLSMHRLPGGGVLEGALEQMKAIRRGSEEGAISGFNASHRAIKDAIRRASEIEQALTEPRLHDLERARQALTVAWPFLKTEVGIGPDLESQAAQLEDLLKRETFYRDIPAIEQHARAIEVEYARRFDDAQQARIDAYGKALDSLTKVPGWLQIGESSQHEIGKPLQDGKLPMPRGTSIQLLRADRDACEMRLRNAIRRLQELREGERLAPVQIQTWFGAGIETEEQLDAALAGLRAECARLIVAGKKVVIS